MKNGKFRIAILLVCFFIGLMFVLHTYAASSYVLPYPSAMPGNKFYTLAKIQEKILKYWYFGNFGQFKYAMKYSDKYLVEAKTLFEYRQYLFAARALEKSNEYFRKTFSLLLAAQKEGKDTADKMSLLKEASEKHKEVLINMQKITPQKFIWRPEESAPTRLNIHSLIDESIEITKVR